MPTIEEIHDGGDSSNATNSNNTRRPQSGDGTSDNYGTSSFNRIVNHMIANKIEAALWLARLCTIFFALNFFIPLLGGHPFSYYQKCLLSNAISSALRLHQRVPNFQFTREYLSQLSMEDSAHYLFYSVIFLTSVPVSMALLPLFLYAVLHTQCYTKTLTGIVNIPGTSFLPRLLSKIETKQVDILRFIACSEIFLMPMTIFMIFTGQGNILFPFLYYRFLSFRYGSRRNPYCRQLFYELRIGTEAFCARPHCPQIVRNALYKSIGFISRLAPAA